MDPNAKLYTPTKAPSTRKSSSLGLKRGRSTTKTTLTSVKAEAAAVAAPSSSSTTNKRPKRGQSQEAQDQGQSEEIDLLSQSTVAVPTGSRTQDTNDDTELDRLHPPPPRSSAVQGLLFDDTVFDRHNLPTSTADANAETAPPAYPSINRTLFPGTDKQQEAVTQGVGEASGDGKSEDDGDDGGDSKHELTDTDEEEEKEGEGEKEEVKMVEEGPDLPCFIHLDSLNLHKTFNICVPLRKYALSCIIIVLLLFIYSFISLRSYLFIYLFIYLCNYLFMCLIIH